MGMSGGMNILKKETQNNRGSAYVLNGNFMGMEKGN